MTVPLDLSGVTALMPAHEEAPGERLLDELCARVGSVLVVADGMPSASLRELRRRSRLRGIRLLELDTRNGKGTAVAAGLELLLRQSAPPTAVIVLDADGQHPPHAIPSFLAAAGEAELVIGDRFGDLASMPFLRRAANRIAQIAVTLSSGRRVRDTQCGMRLLRGRALSEIAFRSGGYEAETVHLKRCLAGGVQIAWVPIPAVYGNESSSFRPLHDSVAVLRAALAGS